MSCPEELLAEVALDIASGPDRALVLEHVEQCASCRRELEAAATAADGLLLLAPSVAVSPELRERAVTVTPATRRSWRRVPVAAALLLVLAAGLFAVSQLRSPMVERSATMRDGTGHMVGTAVLTGRDHATLRLSFVASSPVATYEVQLATTHGPAMVGTAHADGGLCSFERSLSDPVSGVTSLTLLDPATSATAYTARFTTN